MSVVVTACEEAAVLKESHELLCERYDLAMLDLDGVVYVGARAVPGAPEALASARSHGMRLAFITNNAARPPQTVAAHLAELGVASTPADVVTSAQAAARVLVEKLGPGSRVVLLGAAGLQTALVEEGLRPVGVEDSADALVTGYGPDTPWGEIMRAAVRIADGLWWVASNTDGTIPTPYGPAPGHGALVDMLRRFTGVEPTVAGKPARPLLEETIRRVGGRRPLMVGDRLDTDIAGANALELDSLLVLTGVTGLAELVAAEPSERPSYLAPNLDALLEPQPASALTPSGVTVGACAAQVDAAGVLTVEAPGGADGSHAGDWWRAVATACWRYLDTTGRVADTTRVHVPKSQPGEVGR